MLQRKRGRRAVAAAMSCKGAAARILLSIVLTLGMVVAVPATAFAFDGPRQDAYNAAPASGASDDPYRILVTKIGDPEQTRPSAFWSGTGNNAASGEESFVPFSVAFEQRAGNIVDGALVSSMTFDMHDGAGRHEGAAALGPVLPKASGGPADVWGGLESSQQSDWTYAFRLSPYTAQDTSTGDLRIAFAWHGCFATYFDNWEYAFDAVRATSGLSKDKQVKAGDTVTMSYYGGYDVGQTSRGTGYGIDFSTTSTTNTSSSASSVLGDPSSIGYEAVVGEDGFARFSGMDSPQYGGNYTVSIKEHAAKPDEPVRWDASAAQDGSIWATAVRNADGTTHTLTFEGAGAMRDYASADEAPWRSSFAATITAAVIGDGITSIGENALGLERLATVKGGNALATVRDRAFDGAFNLTGIDLSACTLAHVSQDSFGGQKSQVKTKRTVYVKDADSAIAMAGYTSDVASLTAVAVMNGGTFAEGTPFESGKLASPAKDGYTFVTWTSDHDLMHPVSIWKPLTDYPLYAKFVKKSEIEEPVAYSGNQGFDQTVTLLDVGKLPSTSTKNTDIMFYGETDTVFDNRFITPFEGSQDIVFAFNMGRGGNANGGDGSYQKSFSLPYVSIVDASGNVVASYDGGNGTLKLFSTVFDGQDGKVGGNVITAFRIGVDAGALPAGTYTLRFDKGFGANNGISFLGKNVEFRFEVGYAERYRLAYAFDDDTHTATVRGIEALAGYPLDVVVPATTSTGVSQAGYSVTGVAPDAFRGGGALIRSVELPASVAVVGDRAFAGLSALESVRVLAAGDSAAPLWGHGVFSDSADCLLYGFAQSSCAAAAGAYGNMTFASLEDGMYVNNRPVHDGDAVALTKDDADAVVRIVKDGRIVTDNYRGVITNTNVASHADTTSYGWNKLRGQANGKADLVIRTADGTQAAVLGVKCSGFDADASTSRSVVTLPQGNGATIRLDGVGIVETVLYDETLDHFDNYLQDPVPAEGARFSLALGGPGASWGPTHSGWNWQAFKERVDAGLSIVDADGITVATLGNGLYWEALTTSSTVVLGVDPGVLESGSTYTLIADASLTGHNVAASLLKPVHWTFMAAPSDISGCTVADIDPQTWTGEALEPEVRVLAAVPERQMWDDGSKTVSVTPATTRELTSDNFAVSYADNTEVGTATATASGRGSYVGKAEAAFAIVEAPADRAALNETIANIKAYRDGLRISADGSDVPPGETWATSANLAELQAEIDRAQAVADKEGATQREVDAAKAALEAAQKEFDEKSTNTAAPTKVALNGDIAQATRELSRVTVADDGADVVQGRYWASAAQVASMQGDIASAQAVADRADATQGDIDGARQELAEAKGRFFGSAVQQANVDISVLDEVYRSAHADRAGTAVSGDGDDVYTTERWVAEADADALDAALVAAHEAMISTTRTQNSVDAAIDTLQAARVSFEGAKQYGSKPDPRALAAATDEARALLGSVAVDADAAHVAEGSYWVTQEVYDAYAQAIETAQTVLDNADSAQDEFDAALRDLANAAATFSAAQQLGTKLVMSGDSTGNDGVALGGSQQGEGKELAATGDGTPLVPVGITALLALIGIIRWRRGETGS